MTGYCSNSPLRCYHARSMAVLNCADNICLQCGMSLVPSNSLSSSLLIEQRILQLGLGLTLLLLLVLVYIHYANFV